MSAEPDSWAFKEDAETVTKTKSTTPLIWLVSQDVLETKNGSMESVNASQDTISPKVNALFATHGNVSIILHKNVFQTADQMLTTFHHQEHVNVKETFT